MPNILDLFRGKTTTLAEQPVTTGELVHVTGSEVEPVPPKNEKLIDFQKTLYDEWLADWFKAGNLPTHSYDYGKGIHFVEIYHPERANFPISEMYGANSRELVLSKDYDIREHALRFVGGHNNLLAGIGGAPLFIMGAGCLCIATPSTRLLSSTTARRI